MEIQTEILNGTYLNSNDLHSKGNNKQNQKATHKLGENICEWCDLKGINFQNMQTAQRAQFKKQKQNTTTQSKKMGRRSK